MKADQSGSNRLLLSPPHIDGRELEYVRQAFETNFIAPLGPQVDLFEQRFSELVGVSHALAVSSGTAAMHLALRALGIGRGDTVWAATLTFIGGVAPIGYLAAQPVFIDSDPATWTMDVELLEESLKAAACRGRLPSAVVPTDLYGQPCDVDGIVSACRRYDVPVVVDSAEAVGARYKERHAGVGAKAAIYSFNGNKIITTSGGGMLVSDDADLIARARTLSQQAREAVPHYEHLTLGYNYRLSNLLAAVGLGQLEVLEDRVAKRRAIFEAYSEQLRDFPGWSFMPEADYAKCTRWLTVATIDPETAALDRDGVRLALEAQNIEARPCWKPMHLQPVFRDAACVGGGVSERVFETALCLPSGSSMDEVEVARVCTAIRAAVRT